MGEQRPSCSTWFPSDDPATDEEVAAQAEYEAAAGGRRTVDCNDPAASGGSFTCAVRYENTLSDAIGYEDPGESDVMLVRDGQIVQYPLNNEHGWMLQSFVTFLALERSSDGQEECVVDRRPLSTAGGTVQVENAETWADWYRQSFQAFAESSGLGDAYEEAGSGAVLTTDCATLMADDIEAFVVWHQENG